MLIIKWEQVNAQAHYSQKIIFVFKKCFRMFESILNQWVNKTEFQTNQIIERAIRNEQISIWNFCIAIGPTKKQSLRIVPK